MTATHEEIIDQAIDLIRAGWKRGSFKWFSPDGKSEYCAIGALLEVSDCSKSRETILPIHRALNRLCYHLIGIEDIVYFNDHVAESAEDVVALYEKVRAEVGTDGMLT